MHYRNRARARVIAIAAALATLVAAPAGASAAWAEESDGPVQAGIFVQKVDGLSPDFVNGVDVSTVL